MRVLLCVIDALGTCTQGLAISLLRLQTALSHAPNIVVSVHAAPSLPEAARDARAQGFDALVAVEHNISFPASFVVRALVSPSPFVAGIYPLPTLDWARVASTPHECAEELRFRGNVYNLDPAQARRAPDGYIVVRQARLGAVVLKGDALETVAGQPTTSEHQALCAAWGQDIHADLDNPCQSSGLMEFMGCIGRRAFAPDDPQKNLNSTE